MKLVVAVACSGKCIATGEGTLVSTEDEVSYATIRILDRSHGTGGCMLPQDEKGESKYYGQTHCFGTELKAYLHLTSVYKSMLLYP